MNATSIIESIGGWFNARLLNHQKRVLAKYVDQIEVQIYLMIERGHGCSDEIHMAIHDIDGYLYDHHSLYSVPTRRLITSITRDIVDMVDRQTLLYVPFIVDKLRRVVLSAS